MSNSILVIPAEAMVPTWAARGIAQFEEYLANHAAFQAWLSEDDPFTHPA